MTEGPDTLPDSAINVETGDTPGAAQSDTDNTERQRELQILARMRERFDIHTSHWSKIQAVAVEDDKFVAGDQWPNEIKQKREEERRPCLTYNMLPAFCRQITNRMRQERPQITVEAVESNKDDPRYANTAGTKDYSAADVYSGMIKNVEHLSRADQAYDTAGQHAVEHGFGFWYLINQWSRVDPFVQDLIIKRIRNSYAVTLGPEAEEADYRDAQDGFISTMIQKTAFEMKYPEAKYADFSGNTTSAFPGWFESDQLRIARYFYIEYMDDEVLRLNNNAIVYLSDVEDVLDDLEEREGIIIETDDDGEEIRKKVKRPVCRYIKATGNEILDGPHTLPFSMVPIMVVTGEERIVDGEVRLESAIRHAKDPSKSYNYWRSAAAETVALAPKAPWVGTAKMFEGHEAEWEAANESNVPYLEYNIDPQNPNGKPERTFPTQVAAAELSNATQDAADMQSIIGLHDANLGRESNEKSGKAIIARQDQGNTSTFHFPDNMARAMEKQAMLLLEAMPQTYDTQRIQRIRLPDGSTDYVEINKEVKDEESGETFLVRDIAFGRYDVVLDTGPSYQTQMEQAADLQLQLLKILGPEQASNIVHLIVQNMNLPGSSEVASVLRKMLPDYLKTPDERKADLPKGVTLDDKGNPVNADGTPYMPPPSPQQQIIQQDQANKAKELENQGVELAGNKAQAEAKVEAEKSRQLSYELQIEQTKKEAAEAMAEPFENMRGDIEQLVKGANQEFSERLDGFDGNLEQKLEDMAVELLKRVKGYVDTRVAEATRDQQQLAANAGG